MTVNNRNTSPQKPDLKRKNAEMTEYFTNITDRRLPSLIF